MSKIEDGGPVYPFIHTGMKGDGMHTEQRSGMSLRQYYAGQFLAGFAANPSVDWTASDRVGGAVHVSIAAADMLIAALKGGEA